MRILSAPSATYGTPCAPCDAPIRHEHRARQPPSHQDGPAEAPCLCCCGGDFRSRRVPDVGRGRGGGGRARVRALEGGRVSRRLAVTKELHSHQRAWRAARSGRRDSLVLVVVCGGGAVGPAVIKPSHDATWHHLPASSPNPNPTPTPTLSRSLTVAPKSRSEEPRGVLRPDSKGAAVAEHDSPPRPERRRSKVGFQLANPNLDPGHWS